MYVVPTMFNILSNNTLNLQQVLDNFDQLSESDKLLVMSETAVIVCLSSNFEINNIDIRSEYDDQTDYFYLFRFLHPLYKNIRIANSVISVSGAVLYADEQVEATLENLRIDLYRAQAGVFFDMTCRDSSIIFNTTLNIINVELFHSQDRIDIVNRFNPVRYFGAGNINYLNFTSNVFSESVSASSAFFKSSVSLPFNEIYVT